MVVLHQPQAPASGDWGGAKYERQEMSSPCFISPDILCRLESRPMMLQACIACQLRLLNEMLEKTGLDPEIKREEKKMKGQHHIISNIRAKLRSVEARFQLEGDLNHLHVSEFAGSPSGALAGRIFELCYDTTNNDVYINTDGGTTWVKVID